MDWRTALFEQARSDYELVKLLGQAGVPFCHQLHYLQMATEKLAKGFGTPSSGPQPPKVHRAFVRLMQSVKSDPIMRRACNCGPGQIDAYIASLLPAARAIEDLAPAVSNDGPNTEYPWQVPGDVIAPINYPFPTLQFSSRSMVSILTFLDRCFQII